MGRKREFKGTPAQQAMARFLVDVTESIGLDTTAKVAERYPVRGGRSKWAEYLNGSKVIPADLLGQVLTEARRARPDRWRRAELFVDANELRKKAERAASSQDSAGTELISLKKITENVEALRKIHEVEMRSERVISRMTQRAGQQEMRIAGLKRELEHLQEKEREQVTHRLEQARFRLTRIEDELERARSDRYTVEQARRVLLREQQEIRREFERLQQEADDLGVVETEPMSLPDLFAPQLPDEETDRAVDEELDLISTDREQRGVLLSEVLEQASVGPDMEKDSSLRVFPGTVIAEPAPPIDTPDAAPLPAALRTTTELSRTTPDNPATRNSGSTLSPGGPGRRFKARHKIALAGLALAVAGLAAPFVIRSLHDAYASSLGTGAARPSSTGTARPSSTVSAQPSSTVSAPGSSTADKHGSAEKSKGPAEAPGTPLVESPEIPSNTASSKPLAEPAFGLIIVTSPEGKEMCVDEDTNEGQNGDDIHLWECEHSGDTAGQLWTLHSDNTLRAWGKCLGIVGNSVENHARLQLWDCNKSGGQQWLYTADNELKNPQSGLCLDVPKGQMETGTDLEIYRCLGGVWTQQWRFVNPRR